jgi:hypothetical protein
MSCVTFWVVLYVVCNLLALLGAPYKHFYNFSISAFRFSKFCTAHDDAAETLSEGVYTIYKNLEPV